MESILAFLVAARRCEVRELEEIGEPYSNPLRLRTPQPQRGAGGVLHGEVLTIDRFGNAQLNVDRYRGLVRAFFRSGESAFHALGGYAGQVSSPSHVVCGNGFRLPGEPLL